MTQILRGLGRTVSNIGEGLNQAALGVSAASPTWPSFEIQKRQLAQTDTRLELEEVRVKQAQEQARRIAEQQGNELAFRRAEIETKPILLQISTNSSMIQEALRSGNSAAVSALFQQREGLFNQYKTTLTKYVPNQYAHEAVQSIDLNLPPLPAMGSAQESIQDIPDTSSSNPLLQIADSNRRSLIAQAIKKYETMADDIGIESAADQVEDELGGLSREERSIVVRRMTSTGPSGRARYDSDDGIAFDPTTLEIINVPGGPMFGSMTPRQEQVTRELFGMWKTGSTLPRMYSTASLTHGSAWQGYDQGGSVGDIAVLYGLAKMVAPDDSAVREGEFDTMSRAMGWFREKLLLPKRILEGDKLDPKARREMWMLIDDIYRSRKRALMEYSMDFAELAQQRELDPAWVIPGWKHMDPTSLQMQETSQLIRKAAASNTPEIQTELERRFGIREGESLQAVIQWWLDNRAEMRAWQTEFMRRSLNLQNTISTQATEIGIPQ